MARQKKKIIVNTLIKGSGSSRSSGRPREQERTEPYIDLVKACELIKKHNGLDSYVIRDLHNDYLKENPDDYVSYQTFINWNKKIFKQLKVWIWIAKKSGRNLIDIITIPK